MPSTTSRGRDRRLQVGKPPLEGDNLHCELRHPTRPVAEDSPHSDPSFVGEANPIVRLRTRLPPQALTGRKNHRLRRHQHSRTAAGTTGAKHSLPIRPSQLTHTRSHQRQSPQSDMIQDQGIAIRLPQKQNRAPEKTQTTPTGSHPANGPNPHPDTLT